MLGVAEAGSGRRACDGTQGSQFDLRSRLAMEVGSAEFRFPETLRFFALQETRAAELQTNSALPRSLPRGGPGPAGQPRADLQRPLYIYENKAAMSFRMSELQFSGQNEAAMLLKTKAQCKSYSKLRCHALSMA